MKKKRSKSANYQTILSTLPIVAMAMFMFSCQEDEELSRLENKIAEYDAAAVSEEEMKYLSDVDEVFTIVEQMPTYDKDIKGFYNYISSNLTYPAAAKTAGIEGKVFVQFIVDEYGELTEVQAVKGIGGGCDQEAVRVVKESKAWNPGKQRGNDVKVRMILPISFVLNPKPKSTELPIEKTVFKTDHKI